MSPKALQYVMGRSEIGVTLNTYTHLGFEEAREEMNRLFAKTCAVYGARFYTIPCTASG